MPQNGKLLLAALYLFNLLFNRKKLHLHQIVVLFDLLLLFIFPEINKQKCKVSDAKDEPNKFNYRFVVGIKQVGKFGKRIVKKVIYCGKKAYNIKLPRPPCKDGLRSAAYKPAQQKEGYACGKDP